jgi:hypothetical protein
MLERGAVPWALSLVGSEIEMRYRMEALALRAYIASTQGESLRIDFCRHNLFVVGALIVRQWLEVVEREKGRSYGEYDPIYVKITKLGKREVSSKPVFIQDSTSF